MEKFNVIELVGSKARLKILKYLYENKSGTVSKITEATRLNRVAVREYLVEMEKLGIVKIKRVLGNRVLICTLNDRHVFVKEVLPVIFGGLVE